MNVSSQLHSCLPFFPPRLYRLSKRLAAGILRPDSTIPCRKWITRERKQARFIFSRKENLRTQRDSLRLEVPGQTLVQNVHDINAARQLSSSYLLWVQSRISPTKQGGAKLDKCRPAELSLQQKFRPQMIGLALPAFLRDGCLFPLS